MGFYGREERKGGITFLKQQSPNFLERVLNQNKIVVLIDSQVGKGRGQLRALPMIRNVGIKNFTFVDTWSTYKLVSYEYHRFGSSLIEKEVFPLCQFISNETESISDLNITEQLLNWAQLSKETKLVLVLDSTAFCLKNNQDGKPMIEDWDLPDSTFEFRHVFLDLLKSAELDKPAMSFSQTCNLVLHQMARLFFDAIGKRPKRPAELFEYECVPPSSYGWNILKSFANEKTQSECHPHVQNCLRSWIENDVTKITDNIMYALQRCSFDPEKIEKWRKKNRMRRD